MSKDKDNSSKRLLIFVDDSREWGINKIYFIKYRRLSLLE
jgi:hypothetical protein